jgi:hypothetical protein
MALFLAVGPLTCGEFLPPMPRITIKRARIWLCIKIARSNGRLTAAVCQLGDDLSLAGKSAKALGLTIPAAVIDRADELIE